MRRRAKLAIPLAALAVAIAVVAVSLAAGRDDEPKSGDRSGWTSYAPLTDSASGDAQPSQSQAAKPDPAGDEAAAALVMKVQRAAVKEAPATAGPLIARSREAGRITSAQARDLRAAARALARGETPGELMATVDATDWDVRVVIRDAFDALWRRATRIAEPLIDEAVQDGEITQAQADAVRAQIAGARNSAP